MDPVEIRMKNIVREGMFMPAYFGETANACALDRCIEHCADNFHWKEKYPVRDMGNGKVRAAGMALAMQGSCISNVDVGSCTLKLGDGGTYNMMIGAADMGTGCDTILAQMAAEVLDCDADQISVFRGRYGCLSVRLRIICIFHHLCDRNGNAECGTAAAGKYQKDRCRHA